MREQNACNMPEQATATCARVASVFESLEFESARLIERLAEVERAKQALKANPELEGLLRLVRGY